jgi:hypothetical protein
MSILSDTLFVSLWVFSQARAFHPEPLLSNYLDPSPGGSTPGGSTPAPDAIKKGQAGPPPPICAYTGVLDPLRFDRLILGFLFFCADSKTEFCASFDL